MNKHPLHQINFSAQPQAYVIEASAGTGKTWTIERLYIKALLASTKAANANWALNVTNMLVVTFTNDATDELRSRIARKLEETIAQLILYHNQVPLASDDYLSEMIAEIKPQDLAKVLAFLQRSLQNFDQAAIYTIHGFCHRVLQDYPFACATPAHFQLVANKSTLLENLVLNFLRSQVINQPQLQADLPQVLDNLNILFKSNNYEQTLWQRIAAKLPQDLFTLKNGLYSLKYNFSVPASLARLSSRNLPAEEQLQVKAEFLAYLAEYLQQVYGVYNHQVEEVSYDELIQIVADRVTDGQLADQLFAAFPLAFIDEFQDTDAYQWQIFSRIYHLDQQMRGNVVVVGDPKQAIYRFRGADVDTYLEACQQIGNKLTLDDNYRSCPEIMNFINNLFCLEHHNCQVSNSFLGNGINYVAVAAQAKPSLTLPTSEQLQPYVQEGNEFYAQAVQLVAINGATAESRKQRLLLAMTYEILALLAHDPGLKGKIAILVTKNREAEEVVKFLRHYGLKVAELKLGTIFASSTAQDLYAILLALNDLTNMNNFMLALSSRIFNLDLAQTNQLSATTSSVFEYLRKQFFLYKEIWQQRGIISLVYTLLSDIIQLHPPGMVLWSHREVANIWQLAELLNKQALQLHDHLELLHWFKHKLATEDVIDGANEELIRLDNDEEQIIITTQHKAKGLEYDILFCPYFKSNLQLDGAYDYNYRRPFFSTHRYNGKLSSELITDAAVGEMIVANENKEAHRLNYVALTRAKSRIYIYLKQPTVNRKTGKYYQSQRPDKLVELFGYNPNDPSDASHQLFNYSAFFGPTPMLALKQAALMPGVVVYNRDQLQESALSNLLLKHGAAIARAAVSKQQPTNLTCVPENFKAQPAFSRQSYSSLLNHSHDNLAASDYFTPNEEVVAAAYRYAILQDKILHGASFGVLFHELCEKYPLTSAQVTAIILKQANLTPTLSADYGQQLKLMLDEAFNYPLLANASLNTFKYRLAEMEFNITLKSAVAMKAQVAELIGHYFGPDHLFSQACRSLGQLSVGFLVGFIDMIFAHEGKYWVLDYKTNSLNTYTAPRDIHDVTNPLVVSMAEHHYYLQYLLYLVALKRYLQHRLQLADASHLLGGAVYFYVRGVYTAAPNLPYAGVYVDDGCQHLVSELDDLFKAGV